jgi:eukaryotic-like serine/threonine-protein kinase
VTVSAGTRLGPYEVLRPLGAGGMGEVYRARDTRLGRDVAVKVLPAAASVDEGRLRRFEKEARSASSLNHPSIVTVYDFGDSGGTAYIAMELVEGRTLRELLADGGLPLKRLLPIAAQVADGLARAHAAGIVHRDLKPENVMVTTDGFAKILDFGLAKLTEPEAADVDQTSSPTATAGTTPGMVVGTVAYMSPEQALGKPLDFRSDQFSLGAVLYEMITGRRAFQRRSGPETMTAIIREEPPPLRTESPATPVPLGWVVERCLSKEPDERYASTRDLARDLARLREGFTEGSLSSAMVAAAAAPAPRWRAAVLALLAAAAAAAVVGVLAWRRPPRVPPTYRPVSFHRGAIGGARFGPDGQTILYSAAWEGKPAQIFSTRLDSTESTALPLANADLLSISSTGKLAIRVFHGNESSSIAEVAMAGGAPRELVAGDPLEQASLQFSPQLADWQPGGDRLAVVHGGRVEFPPGKALVTPAPGRQVTSLRFSPDGKQIAFVEFRGASDFALAMVDLAGARRDLSSGWEIISSLAWHPGTGELWFSGRRRNSTVGVVDLHAIRPGGPDRLVAQNPQLIIVEDIRKDGLVLARSDDWPETMMCLPPGAARELNLTYLDFSQGVSLSDDGKDLLFLEGGAGAGSAGGVYLRKTDGSTAAVRLGDGWSDKQDLSPDRKWIVQAAVDHLNLVPVGPGDTRTIRDDGFEYFRAAWFPDGKSVLVSGRAKPGGPRKCFVRDLDKGPPRAVTPDGTTGTRVSRDGRRVAAFDVETGRFAIYPVEGGAPIPIPGMRDGETVVNFDETGNGIYVASGTAAQRIDHVDLGTGRRTFVREIAPVDPTGVGQIEAIQITPDGKSYCYSYMSALSRLYAVDGVR